MRAVTEPDDRAGAEPEQQATLWWRRTGDGVVLRIRVQPGARRSEVVGVVGDELKVKVAAPPVEGKANEALVRFLAEMLGVSRRSVAVLRGERGRSKVVEVRDPWADPTRLR